MSTTSQHPKIPAIRFEARLHAIGDTIIVQLPESASKKLPSRGQVMVKGSINGRLLNKVLEPDGRWGHWFRIDQVLQKAIGVSVGDIVALEITPSKDWPEPDVPDDFSQALESASSTVRGLWANITPMARWEWIRWISATANAETRKRRIAASMSKLQSGKRRPCCFNLAACTDPHLAKNGRLIGLAG